MEVTMDGDGGVAIPKDVRDRLGLKPNTALTLDIEGNTTSISPATSPTRGFETLDGLPVFGPVTGWSLTDADVQRLREADQR